MRITNLLVARLTAAHSGNGGSNGVSVITVQVVVSKKKTGMGCSHADVVRLFVVAPVRLNHDILVTLDSDIW